MPIRRSAVLTDIFLFHQVWWKLQRQQVWAVRAPQRHQQCRGGRFNRSPGHRGSARLSDTGCRHLLCTQVSGLFFQELARFCKLQIGHLVLFWIFWSLSVSLLSTCRMLKAKQQSQQNTQQQYWKVKSRVWPFSRCAVGSMGRESLVGPGNVLDKTVIDQLTTGEWH